MSFLFKRDLTTTNAPLDNQLEIGELAFSAKTGTIYGKRADGKIIKFMSVAIDDTSPASDMLRFVPVIKFSDVSGFCCNGDSIIVTVDNLLVNESYTYLLTDMVAGSTTYLSVTSGIMSPITSSRREVSVNIGISNIQNNALIKFSVLKDGVILSENILPICCTTCS